MERLSARTVLAGLWLLAAAAPAAAELPASVERPLHAWDLAEPSLGVLAASEEDAAKGDHANETERLRAEIAYLHRELQHEAWRIDAAKSSAAEANATLKEKEEELKHVRAETADATKRAQEAWREVAQVKQQIKDIRNAKVQEGAPVVAWIAGLPHQQAIAVALGIAGLLSIVGPSTFTRAFLAITGSAVGGLLVASCFDFFLAGTSWLGSVRSLLKGTGLFFSYGLWAVIFVLGMVRWLVGFKCGPYAPAGEEEGDDGSSRAAPAGGGRSGLQEPLLATEPPSGTRQNRSNAVPAPPSRPRPRGTPSSSRTPVARDAV